MVNVLIVSKVSNVHVHFSLMAFSAKNVRRTFVASDIMKLIFLSICSCTPDNRNDNRWDYYFYSFVTLINHQNVIQWIIEFSSCSYIANCLALFRCTCYNNHKKLSNGKPNRQKITSNGRQNRQNTTPNRQSLWEVLKK
jgi:hypothetical protein